MFDVSERGKKNDILTTYVMSQSSTLATMESISRLRAILLDSLGPRGSQRGEPELFDELMHQKSRLLNLFNVGPRSVEEQNEIHSGKCHLSY